MTANGYRTMPLKLTIISYQRLSPGQETTKLLERGSISIGRAAKNDWVLQDPERILSSEHCVVHYKDGDYVLTDTSTNGTFLNDSEQRIPRNQTIPLKNGDRFVLGEYEIEAAIPSVEEDIEVEGPVTDVVLKPGLAPMDANLPNKMAPLLAEGAADIIKPPFDDLLAENRADPGLRPPAPVDSLLAENQGSLGLRRPVPELHASGGIATEPPSDIGGPEGAAYEPPELLAPESPPAVDLRKPPPERATSPFSPPWEEAPAVDLRKPPPERPASLVSPAWEEAPVDHPASESITPTESEVKLVIPDDWWQAPGSPASDVPSAALEPPLASLLQESAPPPPTAKPSVPPPVIQEPAPAPVPVAKSSTPLPAPVAPVTITESAGLDTQALLHAFLEGAELPQMRLNDDQLPEVMASLGAIFRETVRGLMDILLARGDLKGEFRLDRTAIGPIENNPLKTPPGRPPLRVEEAMVLLLVSQKGAYMSPVQAVREGFNDIKAHQLAVMAGIQAALTRLLERFDPGNLETRLEQSVLDNLWPANRKAKYWDLFNAEYQAIAQEAEDDFNELFGDEFARAYEERLRSR